MNSPFIFGKIASDKAFINRKNEIEKLKVNFKSGINTMLISPRRWGKSSLVNKAIKESQKENKKLKICYIDVFKINNELEFYEALMLEVIKSSSSKWEDWIKTTKEFIKGIVPNFNLGIDPQNDISINLTWNDITRSPEEILNLSEQIALKKNFQFVICIDEFQKINGFKNTLQFQQKLRSVWQYHNATSYCLFGSKRHIIIDLFQNQSMPFYRFGDLIFLQKIKSDHWLKHIPKVFKETGKEFSKELIPSILEIAQNHPYYVQQICHQIWINTTKVVTQSLIETSVEELLLYNGIMYAKEIESLSVLQIGYLKAIANKEKKFSSKEVIQKYELGTVGNIQRLKKALENKEIIDFYEKEPCFIDPLFQYWFINKYQ